MSRMFVRAGTLFGVWADDSLANKMAKPHVFSGFPISAPKPYEMLPTQDAWASKRILRGHHRWSPQTTYLLVGPIVAGTGDRNARGIFDDGLRTAEPGHSVGRFCREGSCFCATTRSRRSVSSSIVRIPFGCQNQRKDSRRFQRTRGRRTVYERLGAHRGAFCGGGILF